MTKAELIRRLQEIKQMGFVKSSRRGSTGIGHKIEGLLGIQESNIPIPDLGGRIEVKATRSNVRNLITLFTFNRGVWHIHQRDLISTYGYRDKQGRLALKNTIFYGKPISQGLKIEINEPEHRIYIVDNNNNIVGEYDLYNIVSKFSSKLEKVLLCYADTRKEGSTEYFHFNAAELLSNPSPRKFIQAFKDGLIGIDLRMHLKPNQAVRNRGTGFRMSEGDLKNLYEHVESLLT